MGKSGSLFPIFFALFGLSFRGFAEDWSATLYSILGFPPTITLPASDELESKRLNLRVRAGYDDIYRKKYDHKSALTFSNQYFHVQADFPFRLGQFSNLMTVEAAQEQYLLDNLRDQVTLISRRHLDQPHYSLTWSAIPGNYIIGVGIQINRFRTQDSIRVTAFPRSKDYLANRYFFDLLKPTFGQNLADSLCWRNFELSLGGAIHLKSGPWLGLMVTYGAAAGTGSLEYINTGKKAALQGARRIDVPLTTQHRALNLTLKPEGRPCQEFALIVQQDESGIYLDNNPPSFIDFDSLGEGEWRRILVGASCQWQLQKWQLRIGLATARYHLEFFLRTPVLGFEWGILPIAHAANLRFSQSSSCSQQISIRRKYDWRQLTFDASMTYTHARYDFFVKGQADLEFGLTTAPLDYPYQYALHLWEINLGVVWHLGDVSLQYGFCQLFPYGKRLDRSPIHLSVEKERMKYTYRGGQRHLISLGYPL
jgi:hypothetical protein